MLRLELMSALELLQEYRAGNSAALSILTLLALDGDEASQEVMSRLENNHAETSIVHQDSTQPVSE